MAKPRSQQISLLDTPYYHICSSTVRKVFLCGVDKDTGVSFEHRRIYSECHYKTGDLLACPEIIRKVTEGTTPKLNQ
jgi:hypothetical protein